MRRRGARASGAGAELGPPLHAGAPLPRGDQRAAHQRPGAGAAAHGRRAGVALGAAQPALGPPRAHRRPGAHPHGAALPRGHPRGGARAPDLRAELSDHPPRAAGESRPGVGGRREGMGCVGAV